MGSFPAENDSKALKGYESKVYTDRETECVTRLEKEAEFLFHIARCPVRDYNKSIREATEEQLKAIIECLRNIQLFKKTVPARILVHINDILLTCLSDSASARQAFIKKQSFVQSVLAEIFLKIILTEFHFFFCQWWLK